ncbi:MAG: ribonuclease H-like domain-containing protein [Saprospiraceae bacterium]|nr:ribonuclease H-like domain-containing protein [Saprospiraceae bacterium]MBK9720894.1 ribonuclease H-like domain-containing protein [Saprospiraceae bacterium]
MELNNVLFIDIETVSQYPSYNQLNNHWQALFERKIRYFQEKEPEKSLDQLYNEKAAIYAEFGKIICIGLGFFNKGVLRIKTISGVDEETILIDFFSLISQHFNNPDKNILCGHNIREFDIPYICRRAIIHNLQLPVILNISNRKPWELKFMADTLDMWKFGDQKNFISLELLAACLELESSKGDLDGSKVGEVYYQDQDLDRIAKYCAQDVWVTSNVYLRMNHLPAKEWDEVHFADFK